MATNMPPHNLSEVIDSIIQYINNNDITDDNLYNVKHQIPTEWEIYMRFMMVLRSVRIIMKFK